MDTVMTQPRLTQDDIKTLKEIAKWWSAGKLFAILATGIVSAGYGIVHLIDFLKAHYK